MALVIARFVDDHVVIAGAVVRFVVIAVVAILAASVAQATSPKSPPPMPKDPTAAAYAESESDAKSYSTSRSASDAAASARQSQSQTATGGDGGDASSDATASNAGNAQSVNYSTPRQVPPVFLPALMVSECGAGANAGAADSGGAGAFGVVWTTRRCYALRSAINFFAIGEYETGCKLLTYVNREALNAIDEKPDCKSIASRLNVESQHVVIPRQASPPFDASKFATKEELDRAFKKAQSK